MPKGNTYGNRTTLLNNSQGHFGRLGPSESALAQFLYPFAFRDVVFWFDDFTQNIIANLADHYRLGTDAGSTAFAKSAGLGGRISAATQNTAGDYVGILTAADWLGDNNAGQEMRWRVDNIDAAKWHQGFHDPMGDDTLTALNDIDTPSITNCTTDVAIIGRDTAQTLTTTAFVSDGGTACFNTTKTNLGTYVPVNGEYLVTRVQIATNAASGMVFDVNNALQASAQHGCATANSIEGGTALEASLVYGTLDCAVKTLLVDYWALWEDRR